MQKTRHGIVSLCMATLFIGCVEPPGTSSSGPFMDMDPGMDMMDLAVQDDQGSVDMMSDMTPDLSVDMGCIQDSDCPDALCDVDTGECVTCKAVADMLDEGCSVDAPFCMDGACKACEGGTLYNTEGDLCVACLEDAQCPTVDAPQCGALHQCEPCTEDAAGHMACATTNPSTPYCEAGACVGCLDNSSCHADMPLCGADMECTSCTEDEIGDTACIEATGGEQKACQGGRCVECMANSHCTGKGDAGEDTLCDVNTFTCTALVEGETKVGYPCILDAQCETGAACVDMTFGDTQEDIGSYCLFEKDLQAENKCPSPWAITLNAESQQNNTSRSFCGIVQNIVSPEAVIRTIDADENDPCTMDDECGLGGVCREMQGFKQCTYSCGNSVQCPLSCINGYCI